MSAFGASESGQAQSSYNGEGAQQFIMPTISVPSRRPFTEVGKSLGRLKLLVAGKSGLGKTSLIRAITQSCPHVVHVDPTVPIAMASTGLLPTNTLPYDPPMAQGSCRITKTLASTKPYPQWWREPTSISSLSGSDTAGDMVLDRNVCFVDTPGYQETCRPSDTVEQVSHYVESHLHKCRLDDLNDSNVLRTISGGGGLLVDAVLYMISSSGLSSTDLHYIRQLQSLTNVVPLLAQADLLTAGEMTKSKERISRQLADAGLDLFTFTSQGLDAAGTLNIFAISSKTGTDDDVMDASILMSPEYVQPLVPTDLSSLVSYIFSFDGAACLRHNAANKLLGWRRRDAATGNASFAIAAQTGSTAERRMLLTRTNFSTPLTVSRVSNYSQHEERFCRLQLTNWAADLQRSLVINHLQQICDEFVKRVARKREEGNEALIRDARGQIFTYGSFRLGVYGPGSDIDTLVVAPKYVTRSDYFEIFPGLLKEMAPSDAITDMAVVEDAFVPIIKFEFFGISIDLIFSRIAMLKQLPKEFNVQDSGLLRGLDEAELRSLNGTRVTDEILSLVPEEATFKLALRAIKLWAQRRAIYANIMGFPGGVAWAMLVARVCQLYPKAASSVIVNKFFHIMRRWPWPQPVLLKNVEGGPLQVRVWNPKVYKGDQFHLMPVITPAYPSMCATYNITRSAMTVIQQELTRGCEITDNIMVGKNPWSDLFVKHTFFTQGYKYYISVITASTDKEAHKIWSGYVESKVRVLVQGLEQHQSIALAHAFNKGYERRHRCTSDEEVQQIQAGSLNFLVKDSQVTDDTGALKEEKLETKAELNGIPGLKTETDNIPGLEAEALDTNVGSKKEIIEEDKFKLEDEHQVKLEDCKPRSPLAEVFTTTHYIGLTLSEGAKSLDLSYQVDNFKSLCTSWDKYEPTLNSLTVQHVRSFNLPDDVFEPGEKKPLKPQKRQNATNGAAQVKKRGASEETPQPPAKRQAASVTAAG
ncbi:Poly(A) polymerase pla1 [Colletotrichum aenigma]|uniref:Poly(A) polymerase pla1 n=1 Tax=Colletotrichum aenigma TaxID=1215731 RepID=UPI00187282E8|nr:Poly(A) polymerase pla1 [Colletotrichum aenigma]KAF5528046.1 Poly(A) polymerase pla1 [Colletotrichum aenigma]